MRGDEVNDLNYFRDCKVIFSSKMPLGLRNVLSRRDAVYGIINVDKIEYRYKEQTVETKWYNKNGKFITKFWHSISNGHLVHLTNGEYDLNEILNNLDILANRL